MDTPARPRVESALKALAEGTLYCPFCEASGAALTPSEDGPRPEFYEASVEARETGDDRMMHTVYCGKEDRNILIAYRPTGGLPECPTCESAFDVVADPPARHFRPTPSFRAVARCEGCGEEIGPVEYVAFDVLDGGLLGN